MDNGGFFFNSGDISPPVHSATWHSLSGQYPNRDHSQAFHFDASGDSFLLRELVGKFGSVSSSGDIFSGSGAGFYNLRPDPNSDKSGPLISAEFNPKPQLGQNQNQTQLGNSQQSTVSQQNPIPIPNEPKSRKRKSITSSELNESATTLSVKNVGAEESLSPKKPENGNGRLKPPEPTRDYIHVRARRGQATDSHSLAERVRREKISERMKFLQDLVPGCNKITGKALMLDEIINYVQSLQQQVEFLSMKLASINTSSSFIDSSNSGFFGQNQEIHGNVTSGAVTHSSADVIDSAFCRDLGLFDGFGEVASQDPTFCGDDLQSLVQTGFCQNRALVFHNVRGLNQASS